MDDTPALNPPDRRYTAFLSYRHADNKDEGRRWAEWLHQGIETYEVPRDLVGKPNMRGEPIPPSLYPVFRDEEELPADADLSENIHRALRHSASLIVLCSPRACESRFVDQEIRGFKELGKTDRILALMLDGEPNASDDPAKMKLGLQECLPEALRFGVRGEDGSVDWSTRCEPIAADVRPEGRPDQAYTTGAAYRIALEKSGTPPREARRLSASHEERLNLARLKILAGLLGVPLGQLRDRDAAYRLKKARRRQWLATAIAISTLLLTAFALWQRSEAHTQRNEARAQEAKVRAQLKEASRADFATAQARIADGKWTEGIAFLGRSLRFDPENHYAQDALWQMLRRRAHSVLSARVLPGVDVAQARFSADGKHVNLKLVEGGNRMWNPATGTVSDAPAVEFPETPSLGTSPDGTRRIQITGNVAQILDAETGQPIGSPMQPGFEFASAIFSPDGARIITFHGGDISAVLSPSGARSEDRNVVHVWDARTGRACGPPLQHDTSIVSASFSPDGSQQLLTHDAYHMVRVWPAHQSRSHCILVPQDGSPRLPRFSADGTRFATASAVGEVRIWETATARSLAKLSEPVEGIAEMRFTTTGATLVTFSGKGVLRTWDSATGAPVSLPKTFGSEATLVRLSGDATRVVAGGNDQTAKLIDTQEGRELVANIPFDHLSGATGFSSDGSRLFVVGPGGTIALFDARTGASMGAVQHPASITAAEMNRDGSRLLVSSADLQLKLWHIPSLQSVNLPSPGTPADAFAFSPDGKSAAVSGSGVLFLLDLEKAAPRGLPIPVSAGTLAFNPDSNQLISTDPYGGIALLDCDSGLPLGRPWLHEKLTGVAISPDGSLLASTGGDDTVRIWQIRSRKPLAPNIAERLTTFASGRTLHPDFGRLISQGTEERLATWSALSKELEGSPWLDVAAQTFVGGGSPTAGPLVPNTRETATAWIQARNPMLYRHILEIDPAHPLLPFLLAAVESGDSDGHPSNPKRAAWLVAYGLKHLPSSVTAPDLRTAAHLVAKASTTVPGLKPGALALLDRAQMLDPKEPEESQKLRQSLQ